MECSPPTCANVSFRLKPNRQAKQHHILLGFPHLTTRLLTSELHTIPGCVPNLALFTDSNSWHGIYRVMQLRRNEIRHVREFYLFIFSCEAI